MNLGVNVYSSAILISQAMLSCYISDVLFQIAAIQYKDVWHLQKFQTAGLN